MSMRQMLGVSLLMAALGSAGLYVYSAGDADEQQPASEKPQAIAVEVGELDVRTAETEHRTNGRIVAVRSVRLTSEVNGRVTEIGISDGARLEQGALVVRFDDDSERAALAAARARLEESRRQRLRTADLNARGLAPQADLDAARAAEEAAVAELARARVALDDRTVRAPFDGEVGFVAVEQGAVVAPGDELATLATTSRLRVRFELPQRFGAAVAADSRVRVADPNGQRREATVETVSPLAREGGRSVEVEAVLEPQAAPDPPPARGEQRWLPGAFVTVDVVVERRPDALFAPDTSLLWSGPNAYVFVVDDKGMARRFAVRPGVSKGNHIELRDADLDADARIVVSGAQKLSDGDAVKIVDTASSRS
ncbi:MAG: efflux RND transporter periplasmic adaptor subunit [Gammaproteobacteria bacterium]|nr:efflux RND transporter periplasmic adaptor subunit [Gammaproteobacteria bacterium]